MEEKIQIKSISGTILFELEKENNTIKDTLIEAVKQNADLRNAELCGANLSDANLRGANLRGADLRNADLSNADLRGVDLRWADLRNADLSNADLGDADLCNANLGGAYLRGADLGGANLRGADLGGWGKLKSSNDILIVGTIGSRNDYTTLFHTDKGVFVKCGCFSGTLNEFEIKVKETHHGNEHERNYLALIEFAKVKFGE